MLFEETSLVYVLLPVIAGVVVVSLLLRWRVEAREKDAVGRALKTLKINTIGCGVMCVVLLFALPSTPTLSTFGLPRSVNDIQQGPLLLQLLREYNHAIVRTTDVLYWFLFTFVWWFLTSYHEFAKVIAVAVRRQAAGGANVEGEAAATPASSSIISNVIFWIVLVLIGIVIWNVSARF